MSKFAPTDRSKEIAMVEAQIAHWQSRQESSKGKPRTVELFRVRVAFYERRLERLKA